MLAGVGNGRAVTTVAGRTRGSVLTRCRAGAQPSRPTRVLAGDAGLAVATGSGVAEPASAAQPRSARALPTLRSRASPVAGPARPVVGVAYCARSSGWRVAGERRTMMWRAARSEVDAV